MTAGVALASWRDPHTPLLVVASDTRVSRNGLVVSDSSVKTLEVTSQIAAVFSGPATPGFVAAEMVRTIVRTHRRKPGSPALGFFDIARLFAHFQSEVGGNETDLGETLVVGYFDRVHRAWRAS